MGEKKCTGEGGREKGIRDEEDRDIMSTWGHLSNNQLAKTLSRKELFLRQAWGTRK